MLTVWVVSLPAEAMLCNFDFLRHLGCIERRVMFERSSVHTVNQGTVLPIIFLAREYRELHFEADLFCLYQLVPLPQLAALRDNFIILVVVVIAVVAAADLSIVIVAASVVFSMLLQNTRQITL